MTEDVWKRRRIETGTKYDIMKDSFEMPFSDLPANHFLDIYAKRIALKAADSVVCVRVYSGEKEIRWGSGFVIECDNIDGDQFHSTIITSASLLRTGVILNSLLDDLKVVVILSDCELCEGCIEAYDFHYNLACLKVRADCSSRIARLRHVDDLIKDDPSMDSFYGTKSFELHSCSSIFRLIPGSRVISLGRYYDEKAEIMAAPGEFSTEPCRLDCKELLRSTCRITKCGIGGPLINHNAEVIGINFIHDHFTPFLPINIVLKWWNHFKNFRAYCRPCLGMELSNLFAKQVRKFEKIIHKFPDIRTSIIVDQVTPNSPAHCAGIHKNDIIIKCDGEVVKSSLQFFDLIWDKVGKPVSLSVIRADGSCLNLSVVVADTSLDQFYRWPLDSFTRWTWQHACTELARIKKSEL